MLKRTHLILPVVLLIFCSGTSHAFALTANDREQDGLNGPVRRVKTETAKISTKNGKQVEGPRVVLETATYDIKGAKIDNAYFLAAGGSLTGKEVYKYDARGNIVEMTLHNMDGSLLAKEAYSYEFDAIGNWTKMITSVAVIEGGKMTFEPTEVTYRTVAYFLDEAMMAKMSQPPVPADNTAAPNKVAAANSGVVANPARAEKVENKVAAAPPPISAQDKVSVAAPSSMMATATVSGGPVVKAEGDAPARTAARAPVKPISGGILNGKAVSLPAPAYPDVARRQRTNGMVTVEVVVDVTGRVISAKASGGPVLLQTAAERAALQARFSPTLLSGQPVKVAGQINYNFTLQ